MLGPSISGTKYDRLQPIFFAERGIQSNRAEVQKRDPIRLKIP